MTFAALAERRAVKSCTIQTITEHEMVCKKLQQHDAELLLMHI